MKNALFYILDHDQHVGDLTATESLTCHLAAEQWRAGKRVLIVCDSQQQAEKLDEALWRNDAHQFVPHNLAGEGPRFGSPIELCWPGKRGNAPRAVMINLQSQFVDFATAFHEVIDFVPHEDTLKQLARERYKTYRSVGFNLSTAPAPAI